VDQFKTAVKRVSEAGNTVEVVLLKPEAASYRHELAAASSVDAIQVFTDQASLLRLCVEAKSTSNINVFLHDTVIYGGVIISEDAIRWWPYLHGTSTCKLRAFHFTRPPKSYSQDNNSVSDQFISNHMLLKESGVRLETEDLKERIAELGRLAETCEKERRLQ